MALKIFGSTKPIYCMETN